MRRAPLCEKSGIGTSPPTSPSRNEDLAKWKSKADEQAAVYANRRRIQRERGKRLLAQREEKIERNFAHQFDNGGMDRLYVRGAKMSTSDYCCRRHVQPRAADALSIRDWKAESGQ